MYDQEILEVWKEMDPVSAFSQGIPECAGRVFIPTDESVERVLGRIVALKRTTDDPVERKLLQCFETSLIFEEPYMAPDIALWGYFAYMVKEGIKPAHLIPLTKQFVECLKVCKKRMAKKEWPIVQKTVTMNECSGLVEIIKTVSENTKDKKLKAELAKLVAAVEGYKKAFFVDGVKEGDFTEVFPILEKNDQDVNRKLIYPDIIRDMYDFTETAEGIEAKGTKWLEKELPEFWKMTKALAKKYGVEAKPDAVAREITKRTSLPKAKMVDFIKEMRELEVKVVDKHLVKVSPTYDTRVIETPHYLVNQIPSGAMSTYDCLTKKPFNIFFATTDEKRSPPTGFADTFQLLTHEEYGHCVNFYNSAVHFGAKARDIELISNTFAKAISDGISFRRETEIIEMLALLMKKKNPAPEEKAFLDWIAKREPLEQFYEESAFIVKQWRIMRFLRAICDAKVNMGKMTYAKFVNWAAEKTGLDKKLIFNQTFIFQGNVGYAPVYSMVGESIKEIQMKAKKAKKDMLEFNTYISALGFPGRSIFEERLIEKIKEK